jgi:hypothetical protein
MEEKECIKCGFRSKGNKEKLGLTFCEVCFSFAPEDPEELDKYSQEKTSWRNLNCFRKYVKLSGQAQKQGMIKKATEGKVMSRPAFGYEIKENQLLPAENSLIIEKIFEEFLNTEISLNRLSKKHSLSINGLKKVLRNFTYIGKIKFNNQIHEGTHKPLVSSTLFNHVQNKLDSLGIKNY